jgi:hypothetical protein
MTNFPVACSVGIFIPPVGIESKRKWNEAAAYILNIIVRMAPNNTKKSNIDGIGIDIERRLPATRHTITLEHDENMESKRDIRRMNDSIPSPPFRLLFFFFSHRTEKEKKKKK